MGVQRLGARCQLPGFSGSNSRPVRSFGVGRTRLHRPTERMKLGALSRSPRCCLESERGFVFSQIRVMFSQRRGDGRRKEKCGRGSVSWVNAWAESVCFRFTLTFTEGCKQAFAIWW